MKSFLKTFLASLLAMIIFGAICFFMVGKAISSLEELLNFGQKPIVMPSEAVLTIDMSQITLQEQSQEPSLIERIAIENAPIPMGTLDIVAAINAASFDEAVKIMNMNH